MHLFLYIYYQIYMQIAKILNFCDALSSCRAVIKSHSLFLDEKKLSITEENKGRINTNCRNKKIYAKNKT